MKNNLDEKLNVLKMDFKLLLNFHKSKVPTFHNSNIFFRDFQYSVKRFLEAKQIKCSYDEAGILTEKMIDFLIEESIFNKVNNLGYKLNYPAFQTGAPHTFDLVNI